MGCGQSGSPVTDRDSRDQKRRGDHGDPVRMKGAVRNGVG